ncbi:hypothetical protein A6J33_010310 [Pantoea sp. FDAARGOS_194]|nr:hypothetical protein A6J33_010310 [Pantoea sp. FDAARGOS_194]
MKVTVGQSENKRLTDTESSVIYATSQQQAPPLTAPLFNNLSDNLCGHSRADIKASGLKKYQASRVDT